MLLALGVVALVVVVSVAFLTFGWQAALMPAPDPRAEQGEATLPSTSTESADSPAVAPTPPITEEDATASEAPTPAFPEVDFEAAKEMAERSLALEAALEAARKAAEEARARAAETAPKPTVPPVKPSPPSSRDEMPAFPWPPPRASALHDLPLTWLVDQPATARLRDLDARLTAALDRVGYGQRSYLRVPGGYALSTRVERIAPDGTPQAGAERWALDEGTAPIFSLVDYLKALFLARPGRFRVLVFTVTPVSFAASGPEVTASEAMTWVSSGVARLPASLGEVEIASAPFACTVLIYEFERAAETDPARVVVPGHLDARQHLERAGLWEELAR